MLEDKAANTNDMVDMHHSHHGGINSGGNKLHKGDNQRWQGKLSYPVVGTAKFFKPQSIGDSRDKKGG